VLSRVGEEDIKVIWKEQNINWDFWSDLWKTAHTVIGDEAGFEVATT
jgi:hypothetical protein